MAVAELHHPFDVQETPGVSGGFPCVGNTRIPVRVIVAYARAGMDIEHILWLYPQLTVDQIRGALGYYAASPDRVDEDVRTNNEAFPTPPRR